MKKFIGFLLAFVSGFALFGCERTPENETTVYMPDGAPALAMAKCLAEDTDGDGVTYSIVDTSKEMKTLLSKLTNANQEKNADFCVLPITAAAQLLGSGETYQMLGVVTQGNLYLLANSAQATPINGASDLVGKTVQVAKLSEVPGLTLKAVLNRQGLAWQVLEGENKAVDKVNLVSASLDADFELVAEPAVSKRVSAGKSVVVGDLQALYGQENGYPQAVLVGKRAFMDAYPKFTQEFLAKVQENEVWLKRASAETLFNAVISHYNDGHTPAFNLENLGAETIARCGVRFDGGESAKTRVETYLTEVGFALPSTAFYWGN